MSKKRSGTGGALKKLDPSKSPLLARAHSIEIRTMEDLEECSELLSGLKDLRKKIEEYHRPNIKKASELHKSLIAGMNRQLAMIDPAIDALGGENGKIQAFLAEQERERIRKEAEMNAALRDSVDGVLEDVRKALGDDGADLVSRSMAVGIASIPSAEERLVGVRVQKTWKAEVMEFETFLSAILAGTIPKNVLEVNSGVMNRYAQRFDGCVEWPGVRFYQVSDLRRKRG
jgi:hypothetical protein